MICDRCGIFEIFFKGDRNENGVRIPYDRNGNRHDCDFSYPWACKICNRLIYTDKKIVSPTGKRILLNWEEDTYHYCDTRTNIDRRTEG